MVREEEKHPEDPVGADSDGGEGCGDDGVPAATYRSGEDFDRDIGEEGGGHGMADDHAGVDDRLLAGEQMQECPPMGHQDQAKTDGGYHAHGEGGPHAALDPLVLACPVVLPSENGDGDSEAVDRHPEHGLDLAIGGVAGNHDGSQRVDGSLDQNVGYVVHGTLQSGGNSEQQHAA